MSLNFNMICMRKAIWAVAVLLLLSCVNEDVENSSLSEAYPVEFCAMTVEVEAPESKDMTRSSFTDEQLSRMSTLNVFIYHGGRLLKECCRYFTDMSALTLTLPCNMDGFNIYMVGNVQEMEPPVNEIDMEKVRLVVEDYDDFRATGFPVAACFIGYEKGDLAHFKLMRMTGQYNISMKTSATDAQYLIKDVRLMNCARDMYPFSENVKACDMARTGDTLTLEDLEHLNAGKSVPLYFVENLQGVLLPDNNDKKKKIPSRLELIESGIAGRCTYIEITADILTPAARYSDAKYRFYLGQDQTSDFNIRRNTLYNVTLDFTQNMVNEEEWRIEVDEPEVKSIILSKNEAHVIKGTKDYILIEGPKVKINAENSYASTSSCSYKLTDVTVDGKKYQKLEFNTNYKATGYFDWKKDYRADAKFYGTVTLDTEETFNGSPLSSTSVNVYAYDKLFPVFFRMNSDANSYYQLEALTPAPIHFEFDLSAVFTDKAGKMNSIRCLNAQEVDGYRCCAAQFDKPYDPSNPNAFSSAEISMHGISNEFCNRTELYFDPRGVLDFGPFDNAKPKTFSSVTTEVIKYTTSSASSDEEGYYKMPLRSFKFYQTGSRVLFDFNFYTTKGMHTFYTIDMIKDDIFDDNQTFLDNYMPFYIINGDMSDIRFDNERFNNSPDWLEEVTVGIKYQCFGPGRDLFYPNGVKWSSTKNSPSYLHTGAFRAGFIRQFFGNVRAWLNERYYSGDFFLMINGHTAWPGAKSSKYELYVGGVKYNSLTDPQGFTLP